MIFNTWVFGLFGLVALLVYWGLVPARFRPQALVALGVLFYAYAVPAYLILILALAAITYVLGHAMLRSGESLGRRRLFLALGIVAIVGTLVVFKYTKFLALTVDQVAGRHVLPIPNLIVPLAISFFTFEFVHVLVDVYLGKIVALDLLDFAVFTMFFPTLVAGPIKRFESFAPQVRSIEMPSTPTFMLNVYRIVIGLAKKTIIADSMALFVQPILAPSDLYGRLDYWVAMFAYAAKIYFDFSGYSDIAIGMAGLLGLRIPENFEKPYHAPNIAQFWRRWHISLSSWIRDYIFIPLGGSRGSPIVTACNLFVAMGLAGLWHGAAWTFVVWGLWHGVGLAVHRFWQLAIVPRVALLQAGGRLVGFASVGTTFAFVLVGWLLFAAPSFENAYQAFVHLFV
jgi:alginate O-acetyltransferase complex protein AlgI